VSEKNSLLQQKVNIDGKTGKFFRNFLIFEGYSAIFGMLDEIFHIRQTPTVKYQALYDTMDYEFMIVCFKITVSIKNPI
jgi:hypothetical protein